MGVQRVLLVEDDDRVGTQIVEHLREGGLACTWLRDGDQALRVALDPFHLLILDLMLPGAYGLDILKHVRSRSPVPVLILTGRSFGPEKARALDLGADDYVVKPFLPIELMARVRARLRRPALGGEGPIEVGDISIDLGARCARVRGELAPLTPVELALLTALANIAGTAISREALARKVLESGAASSARSLEVHLSNLRRKLGPAGAQIATVWGFGYRLDASERAEGEGDAP